MLKAYLLNSYLISLLTHAYSFMLIAHYYNILIYLICLFAYCSGIDILLLLILLITTDDIR